MSDENKIAAPAATSPVTVVVNGGEKAIEKKVDEPAQLKEGREKREAKLDEARSKGANEVLKALGVKKAERARMLEEIKSGRMKLAEAKAEVAKAKDEAGDAKFEVEALKPLREESEQLRATLKKYADAEFAALPEPLQKVIVEMKVEDPKARLDMIETFKRAGAVPQAKVDEKKATEEKRATSTTMANAGDKQSPVGPASNHYEQWKKLSDAGQHYLAAQYFNVNRIKILEQRPR